MSVRIIFGYFSVWQIKTHQNSALCSILLLCLCFLFISSDMKIVQNFYLYSVERDEKCDWLLVWHAVNDMSHTDAIDQIWGRACTLAYTATRTLKIKFDKQDCQTYCIFKYMKVLGENLEMQPCQTYIYERKSHWKILMKILMVP